MANMAPTRELSFKTIDRVMKLLQVGKSKGREKKMLAVSSQFCPKFGASKIVRLTEKNIIGILHCLTKTNM